MQQLHPLAGDFAAIAIAVAVANLQLICLCFSFWGVAKAGCNFACTTAATTAQFQFLSSSLSPSFLSLSLCSPARLVCQFGFCLQLIVFSFCLAIAKVVTSLLWPNELKVKPDQQPVTLSCSPPPPLSLTLYLSSFVCSCPCYCINACTTRCRRRPPPTENE